jgi:hypothetical protein
MATRARRDMTVEEFDAWAAARQSVEEAQEACAEEGGPRVSLVPDPISVPVDFLPDEVTVPAGSPGDCRGQLLPVPAIAGPLAGQLTVPFDPQPSRKTGGWGAVRQRLFIETLAETGSVHLSARTAGLSARSAYALRVRSAAFSAAWDTAQQLAVGRLSALAFDRAIHGRIEQVYHDGELIGEKRVPSERLLMWLLARLDPKRFAAPWERRKDDTSDPQGDAQIAFPALLGALNDVAAD